MNAAFKEMGVILDGLLQGRLILVTRKGGIVEPQGGDFRLLYPEFWIFPTIIHQRDEDLSPLLRPLAGQARERYAGIEKVIPFFAAAKVAACWYLHDSAQLKAIAHESPLVELALVERFNFGKEPGLWAVALRVFETQRTYDEPYLQLHSGCRSWVDLPHPLAAGQLTPVLSDGAFEKRMGVLRETLMASGVKEITVTPSE